MVDRTIIATLEQMRSYDYVQGNHDMLLGIGNLAQDLLSGMGLLATSQVVVAGLGASQTASPSLSINIGAGRIYVLSSADNTAVSAIPVDPTIVCQQGSTGPFGSGGTLAPITLTPPSTGQSQWNLIQCQYQQGDTVRANDPTGGVIPFYNSSNPTVPTPTTINTVRQARCVLQVLTGAAVSTGSEVPPQPTNGWTPLYLIDLVGGQTTISNAQIFVAGPSVGTGVPTNYPRAPFIGGLLASHHSGGPGQAPKVVLTSEVQGVLPYANMSPVRTLLGTSLNLYVNAATGNDSNPGTDPSRPFLTIQAAVNSVYRNYDFNGNSCTINIANGTYSTASINTVLFTGIPVGLNTSPILLNGNVASPGSVTINSTNGNAIYAGNGAFVQLQGMTITASGVSQGIVNTQGYGIVAAAGSYVALRGGLIIGACGTAQMAAGVGSTIEYQGQSITLTGSTQYSMIASLGGAIWCNNATLTVTGLGCTQAMVFASQSGSVNAPNMTFVSTAVAPRYIASLNGTIFTNNAGVNYFPGNAAGSTGTGGQYS